MKTELYIIKEGGDLKRWKHENRKTLLKASLIHFTKEFVK
jgi:hypothetical protein